MSSNPLVVVSQPYVPAYRVPLFSAVEERLHDSRVDFVVAAGDPAGAQAARGDSTRPDWRVDLPASSLHIAGRRFQRRRLPAGMRPDLLVSELEALNTLAWSTAFSQTKLVLWGHGAPYVNDSGPVADRIEWSLARRADAVMTYAEGGRRYLVDYGRIDPGKVTAIGNSTDSALLRREYLAVGDAELKQLKMTWPERPRALFVGGLDATKRIDFLVDAAIEAARIDDSFELVVVGRGESAPLLARAGSAVRHISSARGKSLADLGHVVQAVWMPGRIGLVAVDAIALGLPVYTTDYAHHAPEAEFLQQGERVNLPDHPREFAARALALMTESAQSKRKLRDDFPSIDIVADRFADVVLRALNH